MRILIPGGTGQLGAVLRRGLEAAGHQVDVLSRTPSADPNVHVWDGRTLGDWTRWVDQADAVVNLAGRTVNCRYTERNLLQMMHSRVDSARVIGEAIAQSATPPTVWLQASTATIYAHSHGPPHDEGGELGGHEPNVPLYWARSTDIAKAWEATCMAANTPHTRRVLLRSTYIMSPDEGGIFDTLMWLVRRGLGGPISGGKQYVSWMHEHDFVAAILHAIQDDRLEGPLNLAAPNPVPQAELMTTLREHTGTRAALPITHSMAKIGAVYLATDTELIEKSRCVVSNKLPATGFSCTYNTWSEAAEELLSRWAAPGAVHAA